MIKLSTTLALLLVTLSVSSCCSSDQNCDKKETCTLTEKAPYTKKYTNKDYYINGEFQGDVALKAYEDMLSHYDVKLSKFMRDNLWITDFNLGDFENIGMAGLFWVNDPVSNYFGHEIYLLPNQMIAEHQHVKTEFSAKMESWVVTEGYCYSFTTGEVTPNAPKLPESQKGHIISTEFKLQNEGEIMTLKESEITHFTFGGDNGAIITEFGSYHDNAGLRFTNPDVLFVDILNKKL